MSLSTSLASASNFASQVSIFRSLSESFSTIVSWTVNPQSGGGSTYSESLRGNFGPGIILSGHYDCQASIFSSCGSNTAFFGLVVIAAGATLFGVYMVKLRKRSPAEQEGDEEEQVFVDEEGWESKA